VALLYREFDTPILFAAGDAALVEDLPDVAACLLHVPAHFLPPLASRFDMASATPVFRMALDNGTRGGTPGNGMAEPLGPRHAGELRELYADGDAAGEAPDFFMPGQLDDETFYGVREGGTLVAAGGTHVFSAVESVAAIGNVYTRRTHRGRGHAATVVKAIVDALRRRGIATIGLNVRTANTPALRLYEQLGFRIHARFWEGRAVSRGTTP
jgi:GNAT superfamily N-acetyltransferase